MLNTPIIITELHWPLIGDVAHPIIPIITIIIIGYNITTFTTLITTQTTFPAIILPTIIQATTSIPNFPQTTISSDQNPQNFNPL